MDKSVTRILCKREFKIGKPFWWDDEGSVSPPDYPKRHVCENRMLIEGQWYEITKWKDNSFWVTNSQGNSSAHTVYSDEDRANFPDHCDVYGPCDYSKWFYTPEELLEVEAGTYKQSFKDKHAIDVFVGNYHWVKLKEEDGGEWVIAKCVDKRKSDKKCYWAAVDVNNTKSDDDFEEIGHQVDSMETQQGNKDAIERYSELTDVIFPMSDSIRVQGTEDEKWYAPAEYHHQFVREAVEVYLDESWESLGDLFY